MKYLFSNEVSKEAKKVLPNRLVLRLEKCNKLLICSGYKDDKMKCFAICSDSKADVAMLHYFYVSPDVQKNGYSYELLGMLEERLLKDGYNAVFAKFCGEASTVRKNEHMLLKYGFIPLLTEQRNSVYEIKSICESELEEPLNETLKIFAKLNATSTPDRKLVIKKLNEIPDKAISDFKATMKNQKIDIDGITFNSTVGYALCLGERILEVMDCERTGKDFYYVHESYKIPKFSGVLPYKDDGCEKKIYSNDVLLLAVLSELSKRYEDRSERAVDVAIYMPDERSHEYAQNILGLAYEQTFFSEWIKNIEVEEDGD